MSNNYIIQPDGLKKIADKDEPIWFAAWESQRKNIIILSFSLLILSLALIKMETLTFNNNFRQIFRNIYLLWILIWLGWEAGGQVTILSILTWVTAPISQPSWNTLLSDPLLIVLMSSSVT